MINSRTTSGYALWAKLGAPATDGAPRLWLSLEDHSADVAAVFEAMLGVETITRRLACLAQVPDFPDCWRERLAVLVALHDFGKANRGFQARSNPKVTQRIGHVGPGLYLILSNNALAARLADVLRLDAMSTWGSVPALDSAIRAIAAHHGKPLNDSKFRSEYGNSSMHLWGAGADYDPIAALEPLGNAVSRWFPRAFDPGGAPLPDAPPFWHAVAGLVMLADWIGSDKNSFPLYENPTGDRMTEARAKAPCLIAELGFDPSSKRTHLGPITFERISTHAPRPIQQAAGEAQGQIVILEAETGSGKTEAALYRFARLFETGEVDGLYFALPTRVAAKSLYDRVREAVDRLFPEGTRPPVILAVPGYVKADGVAGRPLPGFEVQWDDDPDGGVRRSRWAAEHPKRFLAGTISVGTIDQALLGAIQIRHAHMRSASLLRHLLVVDEVHSSDVYMERLLTSLIRQHTRAGGHALLLSATLGSSSRARLLGGETSRSLTISEAERLDYPAITSNVDPLPRAHAGSGRAKSIALELDHRIGDPRAIAQRALAAAECGAKVLVIRNLHRVAVATAEALLAIAPDHPALFRCNGVPAVHHGRFARRDRELLDGVIDQQMKTGRGKEGLILIGTQTLEQSLDICADYMLTDLCPADVLLQRLGRLHRHAHNDPMRPQGFERPRAVVLAPADLTPLLRKAGYGMGGQHGPYRDLVVLEATRRLVSDHREWRVPHMNRLLVERVTHPEALDALTTELTLSDPAWERSRQTNRGNALGDLQMAVHAAIDWQHAFDEAFTFPEDEHLATRLGAADLVVRFPGEIKGPFGADFDAVAIPSFWLRGIDIAGDVEPKLIATSKDQITFTIQDHVFRYDRLGLHRG